jgi:hypothetical protein
MGLGNPEPSFIDDMKKAQRLDSYGLSYTLSLRYSPDQLERVLPFS